MRRSLFVVVCLSAFLIGAQAAYSAGEAKIAYLDAQKILDKAKAGQKSKALWDEYRDSRKKIIDLEEEDIKRLQADLDKQRAVLSPEARRMKEEALQKKVIDYEKKVAEINRELSTKQKDILQEFNKGLLEAIKKVAEKSGYTFVFDRNPDSGVLLYAKEAFDITDEVIKEYDKTNP